MTVIVIAMYFVIVGIIAYTIWKPLGFAFSPLPPPPNLSLSLSFLHNYAGT